MKMGFELNLQQSQKLMITPELRTAIQILQFNNVELSEYIRNELESNPFLELDEKKYDINTDGGKNDDFRDEKIQLDEDDWKVVLDKYDDISYRTNNSFKGELKQTFESYMSKKISLKDHLIFQLGLNTSSKKDRRIGEFIIGNLDRKGYLKMDTREISIQLSETITDVEKVLKLLQGFDPLGICARNLSECLSIQLKERGIKDEYSYIMVNNYLDEIAQNKIQKIAKDLNITVLRVQSICDIIKMLEPKPSRGFNVESDNIRYIVPDITIEKKDDDYLVFVNDSSIPPIKISEYYTDMSKKTEDKEASKFLSEKLNSSNWLINSIEQRKITLMKVVESIVKFQKNFFDYGSEGLVPLVLKDVADDINVHESTVSRATNGKYVQTPMGLYELKYFFSSGINKKMSDENISSTTVKDKIKKIIEDENPQKPLSDQKIVKLLLEQDIHVSRRTVAKYRDEMQILSSTLRRRY